jgi:hypothetical protein
MFWRKKKMETASAQNLDQRRIASVPIEKLDLLENKLTEVYSKMIAGQTPLSPFPKGFHKSFLVSPKTIITYWGMPVESAKRDVFGIGGNGHIAQFFLKRRCEFRLSVAAYGKMGVDFPDEMLDYFERLTQMETSDAMEWIKRC